MGRSLLVTVAAVALGCWPAATAVGCSPAATAVPSRAPGRSAALELLWSIEGHASECRLVRPTLLSDGRRSLLARLRRGASDAYALPEDPAAPRVTAYASCIVGDEEGTRSITRVAYSRPLEPRDLVALREQFSLDVQWLDEPCEGGEGGCGLRAVRRVAPDVLEHVEALLVGMDASAPDVRRAIATESATALEITVAHVLGTRANVLESVERGPRGLVLTQRILGTDDFALSESEAIDRALARFDWPDGEHEIGFRLRGAIFERYLPLPWPMVEVAVADGAIADRARVRRASRDRVVPLAEVDLDQPRAVSRQAGARAIAARVTRDLSRRRQLEEERVTLLARLFELTQDAEAVVAAIDLLIDLGEVGRARDLALEAADIARDRPEVRDALVRSVAADGALLDAAIARLRPDVPPSDRVELVDAVRRAAADGVSWRTVEESHEVRRTTAPRAPHAIDRVTLPIDALAELGYLLLRAQGASGSFALRVRGGLRIGAPQHVELLAVRWPGPRDEATWASVRSAGPTLERLRWISSAARAQLPPRGEVDVTAVLGEAAVTLRLVLDGADARLVGSSWSLPQAAWSALARDVARPVVSLEGTRFPFPVLRLTLPAETRETVARRLASEEGGTIAGGQCRLDAGTLVCTGTDRGPEALLDVLVVVSEAALRR